MAKKEFLTMAGDNKLLEILGIGKSYQQSTALNIF